MVEALITTLRRLALLLALFAFPIIAFAHRLDECLQATLVFIEPKSVRLEINLTPGVEVASQAIAQIDSDHDGSISKKEEAAYAELLRNHFTLRLDGEKLELKLATARFPPPTDLRTGLAIIEVEFSSSINSLKAGPHRLTLDNRHLPAISVYLVNAAQPKSRAIQIIRQKRNLNQSLGEIEFTFAPSAL